MTPLDYKKIEIICPNCNNAFNIKCEVTFTPVSTDVILCPKCNNIAFQYEEGKLKYSLMKNLELMFLESSIYKDEHPDPKCPKCKKPMKLIDGKFGKFWGCTRYPKCDGKVKYVPDERSD